MEMHASGIKNVLYNYAYHVLDVFCRWALFLKREEPNHHRVKSVAERRAENDRRRSDAQALAAGWQGLRYLK
jgi:hypothetical protein